MIVASLSLCCAVGPSRQLVNARVTRGTTALTLPEIDAFRYSPVSQAAPHLHHICSLGPLNNGLDQCHESKFNNENRLRLGV